MFQELRTLEVIVDAGADAYEVWKSQGNTFGTVADSLASLKGPKGRTPDFGVDDGY